MSVIWEGSLFDNAEKTVDKSKVSAMQAQIKTVIAKLIYESHKNITIKEITEELEKQGIINIGDSNSETGEVKTQPDGYVFEIKENVNDWDVIYVGTGDITPPEVVIALIQNTKGVTNEVIITMTAKADSGIVSYTLPKGTPQICPDETTEITKTVIATENGTYVFTLVNGNGESVTKSIKIDNILKDAIQMSASTTEYTYEKVTATITWPEGSYQAIKQIKIGDGEWQTVTGSTSKIALTQNVVVEARVKNSVTDIVSNTLTISNILQSGTIPISTQEQLLKIGTGEVIKIDGNLYMLETTSKYELKSDIEFTENYQEIASVIRENNIQIKGNDYKIIVTTASGTKEYYIEDSKYYIAVNKYGYVLDGLVLHYDGIDNTGTGVHDITATTWKDLSGNGNDGQLKNFGTTPTSGWGNNYLSFDGVNDWVNCGAINNDYITLDIAYFLKSSYGGDREIIGNWNSGGVGMGYSNGNEFGQGVYIDGEYRTLKSIESNNKHQLITATVGYNGSTLAYYKNGIKQQELEYEGIISPPKLNAVMAIGTNPYGGGELTDGEYADMDIYGVRIYNRGLTEEEAEINGKADEKRFKKEEIVPVYTEEQLLKMGSGESVYVAQESKTYKYEKGIKYEYKNSIEMESDYTTIQEKIKSGEIFIKLNENYIKSSDNYYTYKSQYTIAENAYGYVKSNLQLLLDGIDNTGSGHSSTTTTWKDLSGNNRNGTLTNMTASSAWTEEVLVFDGTDDYVPIAEMNYSNITLETVIKLGAVTDEYQHIINNINSGGVRMFVPTAEENESFAQRAGFEVYIEEQGNYVNTGFNKYSSLLIEVGNKYSLSGTYDGKRLVNRAENEYEYLDVEGTIKTPSKNTYVGLGGNMTSNKVSRRIFQWHYIFSTNLR